ncbi:hypothetical protein MNB_SUP05-5-940 [hydrothermal vent metagenome]|uniref:DUF4381 domain-containing protein n=1 Tax=hydrothermal vent metagenome TaxID=652676 RepID=A0A1W1CD07_9ZZZZ
MKPEVLAILDKLKPIQLPEKIGFELAYGWYILLVVIFIIVALIIYFKKRKTSIKELAFNELSAIETEFEIHKNNQKLATQCNLLLRKYCKQKNIKITPQNFLSVLSQHYPMSNEVKKILSKTIYQNTADINTQLLLDYCGEFIYTLEGKDV